MASAKSWRQPSLRLPFNRSASGSVDDPFVMLLQATVRLHVERDLSVETVPIDFVVDSGASCSLMPLSRAQAEGIAVPGSIHETEVTVRTTAGTREYRVLPGRLRSWWDEGRSGYPFDWPVFILVDARFGAPCLLGLGGVIPTCRWTFDGTYSPDAPFGSATLDDAR